MQSVSFTSTSSSLVSVTVEQNCKQQRNLWLFLRNFYYIYVRISCKGLLCNVVCVHIRKRTGLLCNLVYPYTNVHYMLRCAVVCCRIIIHKLVLVDDTDVFVYTAYRRGISLRRQPMSTIANDSLPMSASLLLMHCIAAIVSRMYWWKVPSERLRFGNFPLSLLLHGKNEETYRESFETLESRTVTLTSAY